VILTQLDIAGFRNIATASLAPHPSLNLLTGNNGSGKSSVLEAIQCLSTGHSFRTRRARELIARSESGFTLTALFTDPTSEREHRAGLLKQRDGSVELRLDFEDIHSIASVTRLLPVKSMTPDSHRLIQEGPDERRQFLDWGVFHMEHSFFETWRQFKRSLSQRNQLLRDMGSEAEIQTWNSLFLESAIQIDKFRKSYVEKLALALEHRLRALDAQFHVELHYRPGWSSDFELEELLVRNLEYHRRMKTTTDGPHRAEMAIQSDNTAARQLLSRGQQKVLVYLLHLAQLDLLRDGQRRQAIVLCDDLTSELDNHHSQQLIKQLVDLQGQVFVSGVNLDVLKHGEHASFHMERGVVKKVV